MGGNYPSLADKCLDLCQALTSQGKEFSLNITMDSSFTFSLDTRGKVNHSTTVARKKMSPSTQRRNAKRREEFLKKKHSAPTDPVDSPGKAVDEGSEENTKDKSEVVKEPAEDSETPVQKLPATQLLRRPSSCRRCGLPTRGHPGPYGEERCRVSLPHLPSIRIEKCSSCMDAPTPPCNNHRKHWT